MTVTYDNLHRLQTYSGLTGSYAYDPTGNLTNNIEGGGSAYAYAHPRIQAVRTAFGYTNLYDLCGNLIVRHGGLTNSQALVYDPENRLAAIAQAGVMSDEFGYAYDGARFGNASIRTRPTFRCGLATSTSKKPAKPCSTSLPTASRSARLKPTRPFMAGATPMRWVITITRTA